VDQRKAINAVLSAQDYALILGMPGTGKVRFDEILSIYFIYFIIDHNHSTNGKSSADGG
jgi:hypothetical protein